MSDLNRLVASIVQFLGEQLRDDSMSADGKESIEVAIQCLESAYSISSSDAHLLPSRSLFEIFSEGIKDENFVKEETTSEDSKKVAETFKTEGNDLMKLEKFEAALKCYTKAVQLDPKNAVLYCNRAASYSKLNNHTFALEDCNRAIQLDPNYSKAYGRMGLAYASLNDHYRAKECYAKAVELDPNNESYKNNLKIAEDKVTKTMNQDPFGGSLPGPFGGFDMNNVLSNPNLMNMAAQLMQDPTMQNLIGGIMGGSGPRESAETTSTSATNADEASGTDESGGPPGGFHAFLRAGQQLAQQMEQSNPEFIEQLRRTMGRGGSRGESDGNSSAGAPPDSNPEQ